MLSIRPQRAADWVTGAMGKRQTSSEASGAQAIRYRPISELIPRTRNARTQLDPQAAPIAGPIRDFGFNHSALVEGENGIIAGHGRVLVPRQLGTTYLTCPFQRGAEARQKVLSEETWLRQAVGRPSVAG